MVGLKFGAFISIMGEPNPGRRDNAGESTLIIGLCDNMREEYGRLFVDIP